MKNNLTMNDFVTKIKSMGHRVNITHYRRGIDIFGQDDVIMPKEFLKTVYANGGYSVMRVQLANGKTFKTFTKCNLSDNWSSRVVHKILLDRMVPNLKSEGVEV